MQSAYNKQPEEGDSTGITNRPNRLLGGVPFCLKPVCPKTDCIFLCWDVLQVIMNNTGISSGGLQWVHFLQQRLYLLFFPIFFLCILTLDSCQNKIIFVTTVQSSMQVMVPYWLLNVENISQAHSSCTSLQLQFTQRNKDKSRWNRESQS